MVPSVLLATLCDLSLFTKHTTLWCHQQVNPARTISFISYFKFSPVNVTDFAMLPPCLHSFCLGFGLKRIMTEHAIVPLDPAISIKIQISSFRFPKWFWSLLGTSPYRQAHIQEKTNVYDRHLFWVVVCDFV